MGSRRDKCGACGAEVGVSAQGLCERCERFMEEHFAGGDARCGFCDAPMPCWCPEPSEEELDRAWRNEQRWRNRVDLPNDDAM